MVSQDSLPLPLNEIRFAIGSCVLQVFHADVSLPSPLANWPLNLANWTPT